MKKIAICRDHLCAVKKEFLIELFEARSSFHDHYELKDLQDARNWDPWREDELHVVELIEKRD